MKYAIGLDVGGTKIEGALFNEKLKAIKKYRKRTEAKKGRNVVLKNILEVINKLKTKKVIGVGLAMPAHERRNGKMTSINNIPCLTNFNLGSYIKKKVRTKVMIENDANCFALAEQRLGAAKGAKNIIGVIIGTGLGAGLIINNKLYTGADGGAGEIGHTIIDSRGIKCTCGKIGDFESWCAGPNIVRHYKKFGGRITSPDPKKIFYSKEKAAKKVMQQTYKKLGIGLGNIVNVLNPEMIVLGGGVSNLPFYDEIRKTVKKSACPSLAKNVKIVKNELGDSSGAIGAVILVFEK
jgi:predicted NBD/HSP70 family sugar kinase